MSRQNTFFSRATPRAPKQLVIRRVGLALLFLLPAAVVFGDIEVKPQYENHEPIVATVTITEVPEGAKLRGSINIEGASYIPAGDNVYHIWAKPGKYRIVAQGVWVLTNEIDVNGQKIPVLLDFGQYQYTKSFVVGEGDDVVPPPPPPPPVPGTKWGLLLRETNNGQSPQLGNLLIQLRQKFPGNKLIIHDPTSVPPSLESLIPSVTPPALVVLARQQDGADKLVKVVPLTATSSVADVEKELN